jgi:hypothetical protein
MNLVSPGASDHNISVGARFAVRQLMVAGVAMGRLVAAISDNVGAAKCCLYDHPVGGQTSQLRSSC